MQTAMLLLVEDPRPTTPRERASERRNMNRATAFAPAEEPAWAGHHDPREQRTDGTLELNHGPMLAVEPVQKPERGRHGPGGRPLSRRRRRRSTTADWAGLLWPDLACTLGLVGAAPHRSQAPPRRAAWAPFSTSAQVQSVPHRPARFL